MLGRSQSRQFFGKDPDNIIVPYSKEQINWLLQMTEEWPLVCLSFVGSIDNHYPGDKLFQFARIHPFVFPKITATAPLSNASLFFTDGSTTGIAAVTINNQSMAIHTMYTSAQLVELAAILRAFELLPNVAFNLYTDSAYIAHSVPLLETIPYIKSTSNTVPLFRKLQRLITGRSQPFFIGHLRAHSNLPGPLSEGNARADLATRLVFPVLTGSIEQAAAAHALHHLNAHTLHLMFKITREQARQIVKQCPACAYPPLWSQPPRTGPQ